MAPSLTDLRALAARALAPLGGEGQATAWWERRLAVGEHGVSDVGQLSVDVVVLRDGRGGSATTTEVDDAGLARRARSRAAQVARRVGPGGARARRRGPGGGAGGRDGRRARRRVAGGRRTGGDRLLARRRRRGAAVVRARRGGGAGASGGR